MRLVSRFLAATLGAIAPVANSSAQSREPASCELASVRSRALAKPGQITGRYANADDVLYLASCGADSVAISPLVWTGVEYALRVAGDSFAVANRPQRTLVFERSDHGAIAVRTSGFGLPARLERTASTDRVPLERLLANDPSGAMQMLRRDTTAIIPRALGIVGTVFNRFPTGRLAALSLVRALQARYPTDAAVLRRYTEMLGTLGRASQAAPLWRRIPDSAADTARRRIGELLRLLPVQADSDWHVPFTPKELFAAPTRKEMVAAARVLSARERSARDVQVVRIDTMLMATDSFLVRILSHATASGRHFGALMTPIHAAPACCATVLDIKGTSPSFSPLDFDRGSRWLPLIGSASSEYAFVVPSIRGEQFNYRGQSWTSDGDRVNGWDGGTDDALTLLEAAHAIDPRVTPGRSCAVGRSRGGAVALLAGARDSRIRCVVSVSGPTDWFAAMFDLMWPREIVVQHGLAVRAAPQEMGGQFIQRVLLPVVEGRWTLSAARREMILTSPLFWVDRLPATLAFHGAEDTSVPARNGRALAQALAARRHGPPGDVRISAAAGHDADPWLIARELPRFLARYLHTSVGKPYPGADAR